MPVNRGILHSTSTQEDDIFEVEINHGNYNNNNGKCHSNGKYHSNEQLNGHLISKHDKKASVAIAPKKRKRGFCGKRQNTVVFAGVIIATVILIILSLVLVITLTDGALKDETKIKDNQRLTIDEILLRKYIPPRHSLFWISDKSYLDTTNGLTQKYIDNMADDVILTKQEMANAGIRSASLVKLSPDNKWLLMTNQTKKLYRHSYYANFYVQNRETKKVIKLENPDKDPNEQIRLCNWANKDSSLVFVYKCNLYYIASLSSGKIQYYQLTSDGVPNSIFNGVPDWVYEEELLFSGKAVEVSPDGKYLSYVTFNASHTSYFSYSIYGPSSRRYPTVDRIAYPKAGFPNPTIQIKIVDLEAVTQQNSSSSKNFSSQTTPIAPPSSISNGDYYYCIMTWSPGNDLFVQWLNRAQNETVCMKYDSATGKATLLEEHNTPGGWIDGDYVTPKFAKDNSNYITLLPKDNFRHLAKVSMQPQGKPDVKYLTSGDFMVVDINCYNADNQILYYRSTQSSPGQRHIYKFNLKTNTNECITCGLLKDSDGTKCTYHEVVFSTKCSYANVVCKGPYVPVSYLVTLDTMKFKNLTSNAHVKKLLTRKALPTERVYTVKSDGLWDIRVKETRPAGFDPSRKYPVLLSVYGGPGTQKVTDKYNIGFDQYLVSANDVILINFDARGSGYYGYKFMYAVYKKLGHYEAVDAINVAKHMRDKPYVDPSRIAIWGWSYGGFYSSTVMGMPSNVITTAVAVAPVTDWRYYDTIYTERFMGLPTPQDNLAGYMNTSVLTKTKNFQGKHFLLIHGTADDNVHFQNAAQLAAALVRDSIKFRSQFYTDKQHGIVTPHVYFLIADYLTTHLRDKEMPYSSLYGLKI